MYFKKKPGKERVRVKRQKEPPLKSGGSQYFQWFDGQKQPYTLNRNRIISPSFTTYSFPSDRINPFSLAAVILPTLIRSS